MKLDKLTVEQTFCSSYRSKNIRRLSVREKFIKVWMAADKQPIRKGFVCSLPGRCSLFHPAVSSSLTDKYGVYILHMSWMEEIVHILCFEYGNYHIQNTKCAFALLHKRQA